VADALRHVADEAVVAEIELLDAHEARFVREWLFLVLRHWISGSYMP
jgi:hypothetical protein